MSEYLYHLQPKDMDGLVLRPLNQLKLTHPDLYKTKVAKYNGREFLLERPISTLDCLWNDVLHLSPVDPTEWKHALMTAGMSEKPFTFFKIPLDRFDANKLAIYLFTKLERFRVDLPDEEFVAFDETRLRAIRQIPEASKQYFTECYQTDKKPLLFFGIPHVLYKGVIDTTELETITV